MKIMPIKIFAKIAIVAFVVSFIFHFFFAIYSGIQVLDEFAGFGKEGLRTLGLNEGQITKYLLEGDEKSSLIERVIYVFSYPFEPFWRSFIYSFLINLGLIIIATSTFYVWNAKNKTI